MRRALIAAALSNTAVVFDRLHLDEDEIVRTGLRVAIDHAAKANLDRRGVHALLDDLADDKGSGTTGDAVRVLRG